METKVLPYRKSIDFCISTIPTDRFISVSKDFSTAKEHTYLKDLSVLEKYLDLVFSEDTKYYETVSEVKICGGDIGALPKTYLKELFSLLQKEKYHNRIYSGEYYHGKIKVLGTSKLFSKISPEDITYKYKVRYNCDFDITNFDEKDFHIFSIDDNIMRKENYDLNDFERNYYRFIIYNTFINDDNKDIAYDCFMNKQFKANVFFKFLHKSVDSVGFTFDDCDFCKTLVRTTAFNEEKCNEYTYNFGIDFVNNEIYKCNRMYDLSPKVELDYDLFESLLKKDTRYLLPYHDEKYCSNCEFFETNYKALNSFIK